MKMKIFLALCAFVGLVAMEDKQCEITFHNDLNMSVTVNDFAIDKGYINKLILPHGKQFKVSIYHYASYQCFGYFLHSSLVPIIRDDTKSTSCAVALSFLLKAKQDSTCEASDNPNILLYSLQIK